jgi:hypothetical protein
MPSWSSLADVGVYGVRQIDWARKRYVDFVDVRSP